MPIYIIKFSLITWTLCNDYVYVKCSCV